MDEKFDYPAHRNYKYSRDYAADCGTDAIMFNRNQFAAVEKIEIVRKGEIATAMVDVKPFTMDALLSCLAVANVDSAIDRVKSLSSIERHSFESESSASEF